MRPLRLFPILHERPWGVRVLAPWLPGVEAARPIGEAWYTSNETPTSAGVTLGEVIAASGDSVLGAVPDDRRCPLLLKLLFTSERLSVQVHPDDQYAARHHGSRGKTEAWHVLDASPQAEVGVGFVRTLGREEAEAAARTGAIESLLDWRATRAGDTWLVPAGTVHAIGAGVVIAEIQEHSDVTYRLYDYGRPRPLHLEHGLEVSELGPYRLANTRRTLAVGRELLASCPYFRLERWEVRGSLSFSPCEPFYHLLLVIGGRGEYAGQPIAPGQAWLVPAASEPADWHLEGEALLMYTSDTPTTAFSDGDARPR